MSYIVTPTITKVINKVRREIVMSCMIEDDMGDSRIISSTGKALTQAEGRHLMDSIIKKYLASREHEAVIATIKVEMEADAKAYLEAQLNG